MAPFPEDEIMTIKRLEVALKRPDYKLLKEGAYKLHEKFHSHHHFQYTDLLKIILDEVEENYAIPPDIKSILVPTIQDILKQNDEIETESRVSNLTSLSYGINKEQPQQEEFKPYQAVAPKFEELQPKNEDKQQEYIKPFQEFASIKPSETTETQEPEPESAIDNDDSQTIVNTFDNVITEDFDTGVPIMQQQNIFESQEEQSEYLSSDIEESQEENPEEIIEDDKEEINEIEEPQEEVEEEIIEEEELEEEPQEEEQVAYYTTETEENENQEDPEEIIEEEINNVEEPQEEVEEEIIEEEIGIETEDETETKQKSIAIFFGQDASNEKIRNIRKYRELTNGNSDFSLREITSLINEIKTQADTNVSELKLILEKLKPTIHKINLLTNSQSANLTDLFVQNDITYSIFNPTDDKRVNILALFGLTNLYKCLECDSEFLDNNEKINPFILQCPKCKQAMLPDLYSAQSEINMDYYNLSIIALANSDTWLLIHPSLNEKLTLNMIRGALKVSSKVKEIYILDKDINVRETYKRLFEEINPEIKINNSTNALEDFFLNT